MKVFTNGIVVILIVVTMSWYANAQNDTEGEEIDEEAFRKTYSISSEQVSKFIADINSARRRGRSRGVTYDAELKTFNSIPFDKKCKDGPIKVLLEDHDPWTFFFPLPVVFRCRGKCPPKHWCLANKRVTRSFFTLEFRKFNVWGMKIFILVGIRRLRLKDEFNCKCIPKCKPIFCFPPRMFNGRRCRCDCPRKVCRRPFVLDPFSCECRCRYKTISCRYGYKFDESKCRCSRE